MPGTTASSQYKLYRTNAVMPWRDYAIIQTISGKTNASFRSYRLKPFYAHEKLVLGKVLKHILRQIENLVHRILMHYW